ncbi:MAG: SH3 domain-containing protein [Acidaminococcus sp.]|jgi:SH3-like domain-containing protein|nr:SH3 domain-containing protein [Acidaminococcus sp.]MCI2100397.1 SH3 domain-containing protein [Acidaminococcus sp.]MCI2114718.1 SH3 domain-containing protein [Acidaminococcus sp.]MCI2116707.1 SH3 domain-containing protein [Acidaminococcus sp.]
MLKKSIAVLASCLILGSSVPVWAADVPVKTITRTEKSVSVECPEVTGGNSSATEKINRALSSQVSSFVSEASTLGGGKVHYDVHRADDDVISLTIMMTPQMGVEETQGMTFDRRTGEQRPLSYYYNDAQVKARAENGLQYLYDVEPDKAAVMPDTYYIDEDKSVIGLYHAGSVLDKNEGEIEVNLSAADINDGQGFESEAENAATTAAAQPVKSTSETAAPKTETTKTETVKKEETKPAAKETPKAETTKPAETVTKETPAPAAPKAEEKQAAAETQTPAPVETPKQETPVPEPQPAPQAETPSVLHYSGNYPKGTVVGTEVRMRAGAGTDQDIIGYYENGEVVGVMSSDVATGRKWYQVTRGDGTVGWIAADYLSVEEGSYVRADAVLENRKGTITGTEVRMRGDPSLNGDVLDFFEKGEVVTILDAAEGDGMQWIKVRRDNGAVGWVAAAYCAQE